MKSKKLVSLIIALALVFALAVNVYAAGGTSTGTSTGTDTSGTDTSGTDTSGTDTSGTDTSGTDTSGTDTSTSDTTGGLSDDGTLNFSYAGTTMDKSNVVLNLSVPTSSGGTIILNPYNLAFIDPTDNDASTAAVYVGGYNYIKNNTAEAVDVDWTVTGTANGKAVFAKSISSTSTTNDVYLPIMVSKTADDKTDPTAGLVNKKVSYVTAEEQVGDTVTVDGNTSAIETGATRAQYLGFGLQPTQYDTNDPTKVTGGSQINTGSKLAEKWTAEDTVSVAFVFTFTVAE